MKLFLKCEELVFSVFLNLGNGKVVVFNLVWPTNNRYGLFGNDF